MHGMTPNHTHVAIAYSQNIDLALSNKMKVSLVGGQTVATLAPTDVLDNVKANKR